MQTKKKKKDRLLCLKKKNNSIKKKASKSKIEYIVCFDFDQCLMTNHWYRDTLSYSKINRLNNLIPPKEDFAHPNIKELFIDLIDRLNVKVAIASFGFTKVIYNTLVNLLGKPYADKIFIITPGYFKGDGLKEGDHHLLGNKNIQLKRIAWRYYLENKLNKIIFFDDDRKNIDPAVDIGINAHVAAPYDGSLDYLIYQHLNVKNPFIKKLI